MQGYRIYNTWMGDPSKIVLLEEVLRVIHRENLVEAASDTGSYLLQGLLQLQVSAVHDSVHDFHFVLGCWVCSVGMFERIWVHVNVLV